ncbi:MAG: DUF2062 domain-containing protein [Acidobacteria bacterium]|nr:DUF2062 domain-containing protein [Acidobacteriota bacterium]
MIHLTKTLVRRWMESLLHIHDSPRRTAAAYALGVFFSFSPFFGIHTLLGLAFAFLFNLNRVAVILGVYTNLPWVIAPYYTATTMAAAAVLGTHTPPDFAFRLRQLLELSFVSREFWSGLGRLLEPLVWPFVFGSLVGATVLSALSYAVSLPFIVAGRKHLHLRHHVPPSPEDR